MTADLKTLEPILVNATGEARLLSISQSTFYSKISAAFIPPAVYIGDSPRWIVRNPKAGQKTDALRRSNGQLCRHRRRGDERQYIRADKRYLVTTRDT